MFGKGKISLSKKIKDSVKSAVKYINNFEDTAINIAIENQFDYVICGHIHQPIIKEIETKNGKTMYLNSGDWIENLSALEYNNKEWLLYKFNETEYELKTKQEELEDTDILDQTSKEIFGQLVADFNFNAK